MSLKQELETEDVSHLDLSGFSQVASGTSVAEALDKMRQEEHNVCLVTTGGRKLLGIVTDRDILHQVAGGLRLLEPIDAIMTPDPVTILPNFSAADALWLMDRKHIRNLPVVDHDGYVVGNMTHQTIIRFLASRYPTVVLNLPPRPDQVATTVEGGD